MAAPPATGGANRGVSSTLARASDRADTPCYAPAIRVAGEWGMWMSRVVAALLAGLAAAAAVAFSSAAQAAAPRADLAIAASAVGGKVGQGVDVRYVIRNNGPETVLPLSWVVDVVAPAGTRIVNTGAAACEVVTTGSHLRCRYPVTVKSGDRLNATFRVRIDKAPTGCGRLALTYSDDPRPGNNAANVRVTVDGLPANCAATATKSPSPKASRSRTASPSASPSEVVEPGALETSDEVTAAPPVAAGAEGDSGMGLGGMLVIGGGAILVALGGLLVWRLLRADPEDDWDPDDGDTRPLRL